MRALLLMIVVAGCSNKAAGPSCHDRVVAMSAHLAAPRSFAELHATPASSQEIAKQLVTAVGSCKAAADVLADLGTDKVGDDKRAFLRDKLPPALESCGCASPAGADPDKVGALVEQLFDTWNK